MVHAAVKIGGGQHLHPACHHRGIARVRTDSVDSVREGVSQLSQQRLYKQSHAIFKAICSEWHVKLLLDGTPCRPRGRWWYKQVKQP